MDHTPHRSTARLPLLSRAATGTIALATLATLASATPAHADPAPATRTMSLASPFSGERLAPEALRGAAGKIAWSVELVRLPAGTYTMGALPTEGGDPKATPAHDETVRSFWMADVETPWGLFERFCDPAEKAAWPSPDWTCPTVGDTKGMRRADLPVVNVTWWEAVYFCNWLTTKELGAGEQVYVFSGEGDARTVEIRADKHGYRLPFAAEWEWAARAGDATSLYAGYGHPSWGCDYVNTQAACDRGHADSFDGPSPARPPESGKGAFKANAWKLFQMTGNVQEWVNDAAPGSKGEPDRLRAFRGGSWDLQKVVVNPSQPDLERTLDAAWVFYGSQDLPSRRRVDHGFRIARSE